MSDLCQCLIPKYNKFCYSPFLRNVAVIEYLTKCPCNHSFPKIKNKTWARVFTQKNNIAANFIKTAKYYKTEVQDI